MVKLFGDSRRAEGRKSSKGNQLKWTMDHVWYKADYTGYEGLAEYMVSHLLRHSTMDEAGFILYETEEIAYEDAIYLGCRSRNFLPEGWQLITLERLFQSCYGESLHKCIHNIGELDERIRFLVEHTTRLTGLEDFGKYMSILMTVDAFFLNEDRHMHNIAVLLDEGRRYHYCPVFDNGASLLADTTVDYPMGVQVEKLLAKPRPKTFCSDFEEQLDRTEVLYGKHIRFSFTRREVEELLRREAYYPDEIKRRVEYVIMEQMNTYRYLFSDSSGF